MRLAAPEGEGRAVSRNLLKRLVQRWKTYQMLHQPKRFWEKKLRDNFTLRGTGHSGLSVAQNEAIYEVKRAIMADLLKRHAVDMATARVLEVGCGTGFWTAFCRTQGVKDYTGIDIAAIVPEQLAPRFPMYQFAQANIAAGILPDGGSFDVVLCVDVCQHIADPEDFRRALKAIRAAAVPAGHLIITGWYLPDYPMHYGDVSWARPHYEAVFPKEEWRDEVPFNDKVLLLLQKNPTGAG